MTPVGRTRVELRRSERIAVVALLLVASLLVAHPAAAAPAARCELPAAGEPFRTATPEQQDLDVTQLRRAVNQLSLRSRLSVRVFRNNCLVAQSALTPITDNVSNNLWSVTKSVTSLLTGIAIGDGKLSLDDPIGRYLPEGPSWGSPKHRALTVRQLLTQSSGLDQAILAEALTLGLDPSQPRQALAQPFVHEPGTTFQYSQLNISLLGFVVQRAVGEDLQEYAQRRLFGPIGIRDGSYFWLRDRSGLVYGYSNLFMKPKQLARLALLMSNGGTWRGTRVVPADYVKAVSQPSPTNGCYGFLFWTNRGTPCTGADIPSAQTVDHRMVPSAPVDTYEMNGTGGQLAIMVPSLGLTVVTTGYFGNIALNPQTLLGAGPSDEMQYTFFRSLLKAFRDVDVPDPGPFRGDRLQLDLNPMNFLSPKVLLRSLLASPSCNVLVCDGTIPTQGLIRNVQALPGLAAAG
ncbi:serine hydrolase [Aeromicrobium terrae]|uniref:Serine hydrolase n=1 Tax=Aeromicrobium terrae TaxID=2498846 RepID=A0A5C8NFQ3_9ACTN|nr:serine hydrolase [Aeromicrobium terrae]